MNTAFGKYLSLTAALSAINCSPAAQQAKVSSQAGSAQKYDCSSLDLTQKAGFSTSYVANKEKFCYDISSEEGRYYDFIANCDERKMPLPGYAAVLREFAGPEKGLIELRLVLKVSGDSIEYIPFVREPSGEISTLPGVPKEIFPKNLEQLFSNGVEMLDQAKNVPEVCKELLEYPVCKMPEYKPSAQ